MFDTDLADVQSEAASLRDRDAVAIRLRALVRRAAAVLPPVWPLETFIACNPLLGLEEKPFAEAAAEAARLFGGRTHLALADYAAQIAAGKIDAGALDAAFDAAFRFVDGSFAVAGRAVERRTLLRAHLEAGADLPVAARQADPALSLAVGQAVKWCVAYFDAGVAAWPLPNRDQGLYRCWRGLAPHDRELTAALGAAAPAALAALPTTAEEALAGALAAAGLADDAAMAQRLAERAAALPGWCGFAVWAERHPADWRGAPADLVDVLALVLSVETLARAVLPSAAGAAASGPLAPDATLAAAGLTPREIAAVSTAERAAVGAVLADAEPALRQLCLEAAEATFRDRLIGALAAATPPAEPAAEAESRPVAQALFCIDVRSEPFRRRLESQGAIETFGYAGFFGIPMRHTPFDGGPSRSLCPVLLSPALTVAEAPRAGGFEAARNAAAAAERARDVAGAFDRAKRDLVAPFALAEAVGVVSGAAMIARTLAPAWARRVAARLKASATRLDAFAPDLAACGHGLTLEGRVFYAQAMLAMTGMGAPRGRLLAVIGHGGETVNNAYASALDCGACGGAAGGPSAKAMAAILNDPDVRSRLAALGLPLPQDCWAIAGQHNTTTDEVVLYARDAVPASHRADLAAFAAALAAAGRLNREARAAALGVSGDACAAIAARAGDWAQVRPEWGLAGCAAFIVGPRRLTAGVDLKGRAFLHSYDWRADPEGRALTVILTAPMVVAQWISCQYYFSTVDPDVWGSGDKATQNVVGGVGVMQGNESDLRRGLPLQSVRDDDGRPHHDPLRLTTVVEAPVERVEAVIAANPVLRKLFGGGWVGLAVLDPVSGERLRRRPEGRWEPIAAPPAAPALPPTGFVTL